MRMKYEHVSYGLGFATEPGRDLRVYSICKKGNVEKVLTHRFSVKGGLSVYEAYSWLILQSMKEITGIPLYSEHIE